MMRIINLLPEADSISMNLLSKSGLVHNRVTRDLNILESSVKEAAFHLQSDGLQSLLDKHFKLDNLKESDLNKQAEGGRLHDRGVVDDERGDAPPTYQQR